MTDKIEKVYLVVEYVVQEIMDIHGVFLDRKDADNKVLELQKDSLYSKFIVDERDVE